MLAVSPWAWLVLAGTVEVAWSQSIKPTESFTRPLPTILCFVLGAGSVYLLTQAMAALPVGTSYVVFTGIGAVGAVLLGIAVSGDPVTLPRLVGLALILAGVVVCHLAETA
jgi:quaternary ammonium compound-resistance protein SugE